MDTRQTGAAFTFLDLYLALQQLSQQLPPEQKANYTVSEVGTSGTTHQGPSASISGAQIFESREAKDLPVSDHYLALSQQLPPEKILSVNGRPVYCRSYRKEDGVEKLFREAVLVQWTMHSVRDVENGTISLSISEKFLHERYEFGFMEEKGFKKFDEPLASNYLEMFTQKLEEFGITLPKSNPGWPVKINLALSPSLAKLTLETFRGKTYFERLFEAMPVELRTLYNIKYADDKQKMQQLVADVMIASFAEQGLHIKKPDHMTTASTFATSIAYYYIAPGINERNCGSRDLWIRNRAFAHQAATKAIHNLGMIEIDAHRKYRDGQAQTSIKDRQIICDMKNFFDLAVALKVRPNEVRTARNREELLKSFSDQPAATLETTTTAPSDTGAGGPATLFDTRPATEVARTLPAQTAGQSAAAERKCN